MRTYPQGVTSWIDTEQPDPAAAAAFYAGLFGWALTEAMPPGAPGSYLIATLDGQDVGAIAPGEGSATWNTYVAVDDADATTALFDAAGAQVTQPPTDAGPAGRSAALIDPAGAPFRLWQAGRRQGSQVSNSPGTWNFSHLHTPDVAAAAAWYAGPFGWAMGDFGEDAGAMFRVPGYGDHLAATVDPDIHERQAGAPPGFADVVGAIVPTTPGEAPHWHVVFSVSDRDASIVTAEKLGARLVSSAETHWTREARIRDPQGAEFTLSQFTPPAGF